MFHATFYSCAKKNTCIHLRLILMIAYFYRTVTKMGQEILTFVFAWIFSSVLIDESETSKS